MLKITPASICVAFGLPHSRRSGQTSAWMRPAGGRTCATGAAEIAVEEAQGDRGVMVSCSDQSLDTVVELAKHAQAIGADYIVVHTPLLYFGAHSDDTLYEYYRYIAEQVDIGVTLWNQPPDCGYCRDSQRGGNQVQRASGNLQPAYQDVTGQTDREHVE